MNLRNLALPALAAITALTSGCIVVDDTGPNTRPAPVVVNYAPEVWDGEAGCYYDGYERDDIWYFEAVVDDLDGLGDVTSVWADVYDEFDGTLVESFELYPTDDPEVWFSDWLGRTTYLDCGYL
ncbi:MAG: hypothetical protein AB8H79_26210, partial [Myxococcota bacterium]